ncbi:MAG: hypothetical protein ABIR91_04460 [Candidatus Saccharimonadales bacterium]
MKDNTQTLQTPIEAALVNQYITQDLKTSILILSLLVNLAILTAWVAIQVTTAFDTQLVVALFNR